MNKATSTKKIAIMQPYIFPYLGYFQLINSVDMFIFLDDVNFIKKGWINRNRLVVNGSSQYFTIPCKKISQNKLICETEVDWSSPDIAKFLETVKYNYGNSPYFDDVFRIINKVLNAKKNKISELSELSVRLFCEYLSIETEMKTSSQIDIYNKNLKSSARIIDIVNNENCGQYINAIGGMDLYSKEEFAKNGIELNFLKSNFEERNLGIDDYISYNSIIDIAMMTSAAKIKEYLKFYELI